MFFPAQQAGGPLMSGKLHSMGQESFGCCRALVSCLDFRLWLLSCLFFTPCIPKYEALPRNEPGLNY